MGLKAHRGTFRCQFCDNSPFNAERRYKRGPVCRGRLLFCASLSTLCKSETYSTSCHSSSRSPQRLAAMESNGPINAHPAGVLQKQSVRPLCIFFIFFLLGAQKSHRGRSCQNLCMFIIQRNLSKWYDGFPARWILLHVKAWRTYFWLYQIFFFFFASCLLVSRMQTTASVVHAFPFLFAATTHLVVTSMTPVLTHSVITAI